MRDETFDPDRDAASDGDHPPAPARYVDPVLLGEGGMGTVHAVRDTRLGRIVALKRIRGDADPHALRRFREEALVTAQLDHPGVVAVHELDEDADGLPYLVMQRVDGRSFREVLDEPRTDDRAVRQRVDVLREAARTVAHAHEHRVVHRDLKPENLMIGRFGEVRVVDWGIALRVGGTPDRGGGEPSAHTATGAVTGSLRYLAPEQAAGDAVGPPADVYALGAILVEVLTGRPLRTSHDPVVLVGQAMSPVRLPPHLPDALVGLLEASLALEPERRPTAGAFAEALGDWVRGVEREDLARGRLREVDEAAARSAALLARQDALDAEICGLDAERAEALWAAQDARDAVALARTLEDAEVDRLLGLAANHAPDLPEVHAAVARVARARCERAEHDGDRLAAARNEALVRRHDRGAHAAWLAGDGRLTLHTAPAGLPVVARPVRAEGRRRVPGEPVALGGTPLVDVALPRGSWVLEVGGVTIPVALPRGGRWDGVPPEGGASAPIPLLVPPPGERYVPAGPYLAGGDPEARHPRGRATVWVDGFVIREHPVTHAEFLAFLDDLHATGRGEEALGCVPRQGGVRGAAGPPLYPMVDGAYALPEADWAQLPVFLVDWHGAVAFARWTAARTGLPWRLPTFAEREKAARGVDGRVFPWGDAWHPEWSNTGTSFAEPHPVPVDAFPADVSPYGVRGLAGNVSDWVWDGFDAARRTPARAVVAPVEGRYAAFAGGAWNSGVVYARATNLGRYAPEARVTSLGFRLARSVPGVLSSGPSPD
jgi:formylglycine-generating enzyme required for sulfatase activity